jgi:heterodisulfide reductase subunit A
MSKPILILGGGPAGLAAAHALASVGQRSVLVEKERRLGGAPILSGYAKLVPSGEWAKDAIGGMVTRVEGNPLVSVHKERTVSTFRGEPGAFEATLSGGETLEVGAAILCSGFTHFDSINKPEWGFGTFPDVVTTTQVEQMISSGKGVRCPSDGRKPERVAILLCVGSRDRQIGREWCSKICCTVSCNLAIEIREELPDCHVYIYYMDIRTFGLYETRYYWRSQEEFKVKYIKARIAEVTSDGQRLIIKGEDTLVKRPITIPFDLVVHAIGMDPNVDNRSIASVFGVSLEPHGHIGRGNAYGTYAETSRPGVFVAGAATGPETIDDSIGQARAAALCAFAFVQQPAASAATMA